MDGPGNNAAQSTAPLEQLRALVAEVSAPPLSEPAKILLDTLLEKYPGSAALFYGSGASVSSHENPADLIFDFYLIGKDYEALYTSSALRIVNRLVPPNVFYLETDSRFGKLRAKYAVLTLDHFERLVSAKTFHSYFWARFTQPTRIYDPAGKMTAQLEAALTQAIVRFCGASAGLLEENFKPRDLWLAGLGASYKAELRAENPDRAAKLIESYGSWTDDVTLPALAAASFDIQTENGMISLAGDGSTRKAKAAWRLRALVGAMLSVLRLLKGTQTFNGGMDYIAWKIKRHSGIDINITDWERKHPMLGAPGAALRYYRMKSAKNGAASAR
jgi:hypothetical protein